MKKKTPPKERTSHMRAFHSRTPMASSTCPYGKRSAEAVSYAHSTKGSIGAVRTVQEADMDDMIVASR